MEVWVLENDTLNTMLGKGSSTVGVFRTEGDAAVWVETEGIRLVNECIIKEFGLDPEQHKTHEFEFVDRWDGPSGTVVFSYKGISNFHILFCLSKHEIL